ncbi:MAG: helix-turn-helix domain-containing protein [Candidatus Baldrarchaeia archaeon]
MFWKELVLSIVAGEEVFARKLKEGLQMFRLSVRELARLSGVPESTIYKILSAKRSFRTDTLRAIAMVFKKLEQRDSGAAIAVIAAKHILEMMRSRMIEASGRKFRIREYPASNIEEVLIQAVRAEKDGCLAIVCAPIVASTVEKMVDIPVVTMRPEAEALVEAVTRAIKIISA